MTTRRPNRAGGGQRRSTAPTTFSLACDSLRTLAGAAQFRVEEAPAPSHVAPFAFALQADGAADSVEDSTGRLVLLHDPDGHPAWEGTFRLVTFVRASVELEMVADPAVTDVVWAWLREALHEHGAVWHAESGTVTRTTSQSFGGLADRGVVGELEVRASWTPSDDILLAHGAAWLALLSRLAGLPPVPDGVTTLHRPIRAR